VFFAKEPPKVEIINDTNGDIVNFYEVLQRDFVALEKERRHQQKLDNKRTAFTADYAIRLQQVQIECCDALRIIGSRDVPDAFFYLDPPMQDRIRAIMTGILRRILTAY
jgi:DNA adenine methylase